MCASFEQCYCDYHIHATFNVSIYYSIFPFITTSTAVFPLSNVYITWSLFLKIGTKWKFFILNKPTFEERWDWWILNVYEINNNKRGWISWWTISITWSISRFAAAFSCLDKFQSIEGIFKIESNALQLRLRGRWSINHELRRHFAKKVQHWEA